MILTQELWEEYTAAVPNELNWEELMEAGLTAQACAAANATNWKLEQVTKDYIHLSKQNAEVLRALHRIATIDYRGPLPNGVAIARQALLPIGRSC